MITYIKGRLIEKTPTKIVVESSGIGYEINISLNTFERILDEENIKIYTYLQRKEDSDILFGFSEKSERAIFQQLISISGFVQVLQEQFYLRFHQKKYRMQFGPKI